MKLVKPGFEFLDDIDGSEILKGIERAGRTCYKSEDAITDVSACKFVAARLAQGHESIIEHAKVTVRVICDRGVSHEIVRHRIASYSQESTRYCDYKGEDIEFIIPPWVSIEPGFYADIDLMNPDSIWAIQLLSAEKAYHDLCRRGWKPEQARSVLPNSLKTEIVMTMNLREWRYFFKLRALGLTGKPHPQMLEIVVPLLVAMNNKIPIIFTDLVERLPWEVK